MFLRILLSAAAAGLAAGIILSALQYFTTTPMILHAEEFEVTESSGEHGHGTSDESDAHSHASAEGSEAEGWAPQDGVERTFYTTMSNVLLGVGFALMLLAAMIVLNKPITGHSMLLWALGGFAAVHLAPALGLSVELPGAAAAELAARQIWWLATAVCTAIGMLLLAYRRNPLMMALAVVLIIAPHIYGAPHPEAYSSTVPAELAAHFAAASLVIMGVFWALLGLFSGLIYRRLRF